ncbi:hypothetical protein PACTADRAFT_24517, partial [Pachysolen tannophilus NRRL Y-2460]
RKNLGILTPLERSLWVWANVSNLDKFLTDVYAYFIGNGLQCIIISKVIDWLTLCFIIFLTLFMSNCIDFGLLLSQNNHVTNYSEVKIPQCYSKIPLKQKFFLYVVEVLLVIKIKSFILEDYKKLRDIQNFYNHLLGIKDEELQTISWSLIVQKIMILRDQNTNAMVSDNYHNVISNDLKSKKRLNAHDIANRIMRKENYVIALFNKNILNLSLPFFKSSNNELFLTKTLEWNLNLCIFDFVFQQENGQLNPKFLKESNRLKLSEELRKRFIIAGILNIILAPFLVSYFILYYFLTFFYEFRTNPNLIGNREYTPLAMWKLREFNELYHIFKKRLNLSNEAATKYINQFPKKKIDLVLKFLAFLAESLLSILVVLTILDPENFLNFEIFYHKTVLFYISSLGAVYTICKNSIQDETLVFDPEASLRYVAQFTHYLPGEWEGKLHSEEVKNEFLKFYNLKLIIILKELMSLILLPFILCISLPKSSNRIIDFFREFSVHVDGLGYVCTFAMFNFDENKNIKNTKGNGVVVHGADKLRDEYYSSNDDKMIKSYMYFLESY